MNYSKPTICCSSLRFALVVPFLFIFLSLSDASNVAFTKTSKLKPGAFVAYHPPPPPSPTSTSSEPMKVLYKSNKIAVISKPYGVLTHVGANNWDHSATVSGEAERIFNIPEGGEASARGS